jgi:hypothetical protein
VTRLGEMPRHRKTHHAEAEECELHRASPDC